MVFTGYKHIYSETSMIYTYFNIVTLKQY